MRIENILFNDHEDGRTARNKFLVEKRKQGMAYADIKALGQFPEAESTLRGRYRTLTKQKDERVRKPQWTKDDVSALFFNPALAYISDSVAAFCGGHGL
jgi:hypothetical protein